MSASPLLGVLLHTLGGLTGGSFYAPLRKVNAWSWETYWLAMGVVAWAVMPALFAWITVPELFTVLAASPLQSLLLAYLFGAMWGVGALTFGLSVRYLGISLGMTIVVGFCAAFGTLIPPIVDGQFGTLLGTATGLTVLGGVAVCLVGIALSGYAGTRKERELTDEEKKRTIQEFALLKGFVVATVSGVMSAGMVYGIHAGQPIARVALDLGTPSEYQNNPVFIVVMAGGFTVNAVFCLILNLRNRSIGQYVSGSARLLLVNYAFVILAGVVWYSQFFFYGMGTTMLGDYAFSSWSIQTAFCIIFSNLWGLALAEWKGVSRRTLCLVWWGILVLILSTVVTGAGSYIQTRQAGP